MRTAFVVAASALALSGCVAPRGSSGAGETITYETGPCFGRCPVYRVQLSPDGQGVFTGIRFTQITGERRFTATPAQVATFAGALAPYRPTGEKRYSHGTPDCEHAPTDLPSVDIRWSGKRDDHLYFYYGCGRETLRPMADALGNAPDALPLTDLIGHVP